METDDIRWDDATWMAVEGLAAFCAGQLGSEPSAKVRAWINDPSSHLGAVPDAVRAAYQDRLQNDLSEVYFSVVSGKPSTIWYPVPHLGERARIGVRQRDDHRWEATFVDATEPVPVADAAVDVTPDGPAPELSAPLGVGDLHATFVLASREGSLDLDVDDAYALGRQLRDSVDRRDVEIPQRTLELAADTAAYFVGLLRSGKEAAKSEPLELSEEVALGFFELRAGLCLAVSSATSVDERPRTTSSLPAGSPPSALEREQAYASLRDAYEDFLVETSAAIAWPSFEGEVPEDLRELRRNRRALERAGLFDDFAELTGGAADWMGAIREQQRPSADLSPEHFAHHEAQRLVLRYDLDAEMEAEEAELTRSVRATLLSSRAPRVAAPAHANVVSEFDARLARAGNRAAQSTSTPQLWSGDRVAAAAGTAQADARRFEFVVPEIRAVVDVVVSGTSVRAIAEGLPKGSWLLRLGPFEVRLDAQPAEVGDVALVHSGEARRETGMTSLELDGVRLISVEDHATLLDCVFAPEDEGED